MGESVRGDESRYRQLFDLVPCAIFTVDMEKRITSWNRVAEEMTGHLAADVIGHTCAVFAAPPCPGNCMLFSADFHKPNYNRQCFVRHKNGEVLTVVKCLATLRDPSTGEVIGGIETFHDITERIHHETVRAIAENQILSASRLAALGTLASGIVHELNNPLTVISGNLLRLQEGGEEGDRGDVLASMTRAVDRLGRVIRLLKTYARLDDGVRTVIEVGEVISEVMVLADPLFRQHGIQVEVHRNAERLLCAVNGARLQQAVMNLLVHSRDALCGQQGPRAIDICMASEGERVIIGISDNSSGLSAESLAHVFDPFFPAHAEGKGAGLGLAVSHEIITGFGGSLTVRSRSGEGTRFEIALPLQGE